MTQIDEPNLDKIDQEITDILLEHLVLANDNGQPYIKSTDTAVEAIKALIATQVREATNKTFDKFNKATLAGENQARIDELEMLSDTYYDDGRIDWGDSTKESIEQWGDNHADLWIPTRFVHKHIEDRIAELKGDDK